MQKKCRHRWVSKTENGEILGCFKYEDQFVRLLKRNDVLILQGDTGCGKSSIIPHLILRNFENSNIIVTQPRRLAAVSLAKHVSKTLSQDPEIRSRFNLPASQVPNLVGYRVRFDNKVAKETKLVYATDGIFFMELLQLWAANGFASLPKYSVIIIDEAHERNVRIDLLLMMMYYMLTLNPEIRPKLIVMSATIDAESFISYYKNENFFNKRTLTVSTLFISAKLYERIIHHTALPVEDLIRESVSHVFKSLKLYNEGNVLVFGSGIDFLNSVKASLEYYLEELAQLCNNIKIVRELKKIFDDHVDFMATFVEIQEDHAKIVYLQSICEFTYDELASILNSINDTTNLPCSSDLIDLLIDSDIDLEINYIFDNFFARNFDILLLYGSQSISEQQKIYQTPDDVATQRIVLSTNIAETSLTVPNVCVVVDSGYCFCSAAVEGWE
ncbi:putative ATP-dependent RNA helicase DHX35 homolog [Dermatophagoides farinae]|uniref:putative ATP-dependent RNA helicase DHX35 homolog n=1 Tax=Dermatophagoides farinae TaxID=6954 RepID=UPI003F626931